MTLTTIPPWGRMDDELLADIAGDRIPRDWNSSAASQEKDYEQWLNSTIEEISSSLWPRYVSNGSAWKSPRIGELFDADFNLLEKLHGHLGVRIQSMFNSPLSHSDFFAEEDDNKIGFGFDYSRYDPTLAPMPAGQLRDIIRAGYHNKAGSIDLQLKQVFQRPRPWQMAFIQERARFSFRVAVTATTPSLVSGHCLQGMIGVCNVFAELGTLMSKASIAVLEQFAADLGDRRVFAGVHYPSDSLSSWYTASTLLPHVFSPSKAREVRSFMRNAIERRSAVYAAIKAHVASNHQSPYKPLLKTLERNLKPST